MQNAKRWSECRLEIISIRCEWMQVYRMKLRYQLINFPVNRLSKTPVHSSSTASPHLMHIPRIPISVPNCALFGSDGTEYGRHKLWRQSRMLPRHRHLGPRSVGETFLGSSAGFPTELARPAQLVPTGRVRHFRCLESAESRQHTGLADSASRRR